MGHRLSFAKQIPFLIVYEQGRTADRPLGKINIVAWNRKQTAPASQKLGANKTLLDVGGRVSGFVCSFVFCESCVTRMCDSEGARCRPHGFCQTAQHTQRDFDTVKRANWASHHITEK